MWFKWRRISVYSRQQITEAFWWIFFHLFFSMCIVSVWQVLDKNCGWDEKARLRKKGLNIFVCLGDFAKIPSSQGRNHQFAYCYFCCGLPKSSSDPWRLLSGIKQLNEWQEYWQAQQLAFHASPIGASEWVYALLQVNLKGFICQG